MKQPGIMKQPGKTTTCAAFRLCLVGVLVGAFASGCSKRELDAVGSEKTPLVLLLSPAHSAAPQDVAALSSLLTKQVPGLHVRIDVAPSHQAAINRIRNKRADAGLLPLFPYLFCRQEYRVSAALRVLRDVGKDSYTGEIVVKNDSGAKSLADLSGKTVALANRYSVTGFLLPASLLAAANVKVRPVFAGSHAKALGLLRTGGAHAAAIYAGGAGQDLRVIARTEAVPNEPVFLRAGLKPQTAKKFVLALQKLSATPEGKGLLQKLANVRGFAKTSDAEYKAAYAQIRAAGRQLPDLVQGGWDLYAAERLSADDFAP